MGAFTGERIKIGDLFQPQYQFKNVLHGDSIPHLVQLDNAFFLRRAICKFLCVGEFQFRVAIDPRGHVFHYQIFGSPQNVFLRKLL